MPYTVQFVGLVCFLRERGGARLALLPDGRAPEEGIDPHFGSIVVAPGSVEKAVGWEGVADVGPGNFPLEGCEVVIQGAGVAGKLDTTEHNLPQLREIDPNFEIDPATAKTVAKMHIRDGMLKSRLVPGGTALISQLDVPHDGPIEITVKPDDGSAERTIVLAPGTEIAVTNMARGNLYAQKRRPRVTGSHQGHFRIYEALSKNKVTLTDPATVPPVDESSSHHVLFSKRGAISLYSDCSNTGCC